MEEKYRKIAKLMIGNKEHENQLMKKKISANKFMIASLKVALEKGEK